ncbi:hypothetical protein HELRODRAFT_162485 [Helobdella robusta]|uniref:Uncharacterized protein n=1 Tax=Helobdella robusta TaxID=6412 RepID=T1ESQ5_HELRO|nr:hypothetical protein HELRODRAFT_162485 [Helobdella robusta]ESN99008.1 hypothetical protein HELRODRAFT_162485 [Helobdella robusta]
MVADCDLLDKFILDVFEALPENFYFPISSQEQARKFVKVLHEKGIQYDFICKEINEPDSNFNLWRKSVSRQRVGERIIDRINQPFELFLGSSARDSESSHDRYEDFYFVEPDYFNFTIPPVNKKCKLGRLKKFTNISKNNSIKQTPKANEENHIEESVFSMKCNSSDINNFTVMDHLQEVDDHSDNDSNAVTKNDLDVLSDKSLYNFASAYVSDITNDVLNNYFYEAESSISPLQSFSMKEGSCYEVNKLSNDSYISCTSQFADDHASLLSDDKDFTADEQYLSLDKYSSPFSSKDVSPEGNETSKNISDSNLDARCSLLLTDNHEMTSEHHKFSECNKELTYEEAEHKDMQYKSLKEGEDGVRKLSNACEDSSHGDVIPDEKIIRENECYNSDEDDSDSTKFKENHLYLRKIDRNKTGFIYIFMQPITDNDCSKRFKIGASRNPGRKYLQALNFNIELRFVKAYKVSNMAESLEKVFTEYNCFALHHYSGWFEADEASFLGCLECTIRGIP